MQQHDFDQIRDAFANAAFKAKQIGCDAIELHGGNENIDQFDVL